MKIYALLLVASISIVIRETQGTTEGTCPECTDFLCGPVCVDKMCSKEILINNTDVLGCLNGLNTSLEQLQNFTDNLNFTIGGQIPCCEQVNNTLEETANELNSSILNNTAKCEEINSTLYSSILDNTDLIEEVNNTLYASTLSDDPVGESLINDGVGPDKVIKRLFAGDSIVLTTNPTNIEIAATHPNINDSGSGETLIIDGVGDPRIIRKLIAGTGITLTENPTNIEIEANQIADVTAGAETFIPIKFNPKEQNVFILPGGPLIVAPARPNWPTRTTGRCVWQRIKAIGADRSHVHMHCSYTMTRGGLGGVSDYVADPFVPPGSLVFSPYVFELEVDLSGAPNFLKPKDVGSGPSPEQSGKISIHEADGEGPGISDSFNLCATGGIVFTNVAGVGNVFLFRGEFDAVCLGEAGTAPIFVEFDLQYVARP
jgi:hypothetical protein